MIYLLAWREKEKNTYVQHIVSEIKAVDCLHLLILSVNHHIPRVAQNVDLIRVL